MIQVKCKKCGEIYWWLAMSCDLLPTEKEGPHYQGDVGILRR